jgi:hypothetical protein
VSTGAKSSAIVEFPGRGFVQFDENTDPYFGFLQEGACVLIRLFRIGQLFAQGKNICLQDQTGMALVLSSSVNWQIVGERSTLSVTDGTVRLLRPVQMSLRRRQQVTAIKGVLATEVVTLSEAQLRDLTLWRTRFAGLVVPNLVGQRVDDARRMLKDAGLFIRETEEFTGRAQAGIVLRQTPRAGDQVQPGTLIDIWVEAATVDVTPNVANVITDILMEVSRGLNTVAQNLNARNYAAAAAGINGVRARLKIWSGPSRA